MVQTANSSIAVEQQIAHSSVAHRGKHMASRTERMTQHPSPPIYLLSAKCYALYLLCAICYVLTPAVEADVPHLLRYQGTAVDSNGVGLEGPYKLTFRLYDAATAGTKVWEEILTNVSITKGHFSVLLGQITSLTPMDWTKPCWLSIQVNTEPELSPRQQFTSVPTAITAERLGGNIYTSSDGKLGIGIQTPSGSLDIYEGTKCILHVPKQLNINDDVYINPGNTGGVKIGQTDHTSIVQLAHDGVRGVLSTNNGGLVISGGSGSGRIAIGYDLNPSNILTVIQGSDTDPVADAWTIHSSQATKNILGTSPTSGHLDQIKAVKLYEWTRLPIVKNEEAVKATGKESPTQAEIDSKKRELEGQKAKLPKFNAKRVGLVIEDPNVPREILAFDSEGNPQGLDLSAYIGYLHAALKEAALKIDELETRLSAVESQ